MELEDAKRPGRQAVERRNEVVFALESTVFRSA